MIKTQIFTRKLGHLICLGILVAAAYYLPRFFHLSLAIFLSLVIFNLQYYGWLKKYTDAKPEEFGVWLLPLAFGVGVQIVWPSIAGIWFLFLVAGLGDVAAALVGTFFRRKWWESIPLGKTFYGSYALALTVFVGTICLGLLKPEIVGQPWWWIFKGFILSLALAWVEYRAGQGTDNIFLPLAAAICWLILVWL